MCRRPGVPVDFHAPDEDVLDGLGVSRNYMICYPTNRLTLASGDSLAIARDRVTACAKPRPLATAPGIAPR